MLFGHFCSNKRLAGFGLALALSATTAAADEWWGDPHIRWAPGAPRQGEQNPATIVGTGLLGYCVDTWIASITRTSVVEPTGDPVSPWLFVTVVEVRLAPAPVGCPAGERTPTPYTIPFDLGAVLDRNVRVRLISAPGNPSPEVVLLDELFSLDDEPSTGLLLRNRFEVTATWTAPPPGHHGATDGDAHAVSGASPDTGLLWFFEPTNWEVLVKVLDGCAINGSYWVLGSAATNVGFRLVVRDTNNAAEWVHENPVGVSAGAFADIGAFACD